MVERFENFHNNVALAHKYITKIKTLEMSEFGLKAANVMCLFFLGKNPDGLTPMQLSMLCREDKAGISKSLSLLKEKKFVFACGSESKKYNMVYKITEAGKVVCEKINSCIMRVIEKAGEGISQHDREVFYKVLENIVLNLQAHCGELGV